MAAIQLVDLRKKFDEHWITRGVNLTIPHNEMTCIIGRSGEGKSVLLKQIIGLVKPTSGGVLVNGVDITHLPSEQLKAIYERFGYVFQFAALLDSLNVFENIGITLLERGVPQQDVLDIVKAQLGRVNLPETVLYKYPSDLSGGMRKRVGFARTLVTKPDVILYDEPTTGLDPITSRVIHELMREMQHDLGITSVVVTHDVEFFRYADNIAFLYEGAIAYVGKAATIWESDNPYVYQFIRGLTDGPIPTR
jgi:phospholipid/cholesterol/gamma-HCH transport system ATP-binding protein